MKIEIGKSYKTRDGRKAFIVGSSIKDRWVCELPNGNIATVSKELHTATHSKSLDLMSPWLEPNKVPLEASDIVPGCAIKASEFSKRWMSVLSVSMDCGNLQVSVAGYPFPNSVRAIKASELLEHNWLILYPGETEWKPCWKDA